MGKGAQSLAGLKRDGAEVLIEGTLYDVSQFKHPGGSIVKFLTGDGDAYVLFYIQSNSLGRTPSASSTAARRRRRPF